MALWSTPGWEASRYASQGHLLVAPTSRHEATFKGYWEIGGFRGLLVSGRQQRSWGVSPPCYLLVTTRCSQTASWSDQASSTGPPAGVRTHPRIISAACQTQGAMETYNSLDTMHLVLSFCSTSKVWGGRRKSRKMLLEQNQQERSAGTRGTWRARSWTDG